MKKLLLLSIAVLAMASCGNNNKPQTNANSTNIATTDSSLTDGVDTGMGDSIQSAIKQLSSKINAKDSGQFQVALANIQQKIAELAKTDPEAAKQYIHSLQSWIKENSEKIKTVTNGKDIANAAINALVTTPAEQLVNTLKSTGDVAKVIGENVASNTKNKVNAVAKEAQSQVEQKTVDAINKAKGATIDKANDAAAKRKQKVEEEVNKGRQKANDAINNATNKALKGMGI